MVLLYPFKKLKFRNCKKVDCSTITAPSVSAGLLLLLISGYVAVLRLLMSPPAMPYSWLAVVFCMLGLLGTGCGTTKWSDTGRTGTEQLLLTDAMDRAVAQINFKAVYGKSVTIDSKAIDPATDSKYFISAVRQHLLANGAKVMAKEEDADYVVELRAGAVGTDRNDLMVGVPAVSIPTGWASDSFLGTTTLPEIAVYKSTKQRAVVKIAVFAYNRKNNSPLWQSGNIQTESRIRAYWLLGAGPISSGDICQGTELAGSSLNPTITQIIDLDAAKASEKPPAPAVTLEAFYIEHESNIPTPTLDGPLGEAETDSPEVKEQLLAAKSPEKKSETDSPQEQSPIATPETAVAQNWVLPEMASTTQQSVSPAGGNAAANVSQNNAILLASANANIPANSVHPAPNVVLPPNYQPPPAQPMFQQASGSNGFVPSASTLPWQTVPQTNPAPLAPGFASY